MRIILTMLFAVLCFANPVMAKDARDDGGFGNSRFSEQAPAALGGSTAPITDNVMAVVPPTSPADIEPASGEEDITPEEETLDNGQVIQNSEHQAEPIVINKDLSVR